MSWGLKKNIVLTNTTTITIVNIFFQSSSLDQKDHEIWRLLVTKKIIWRIVEWFVIIDLDLKWYGSQRIKMSFGAGRNSYFLVWWLILLISHINQYKCRYVGNLWKRTAFPKNKRCLCLMKWPFLKYFAESFHQASIHLLFRKKKWCCLSILPRRPSFTPKWVDLWVRFIYTHHTMMMGAILVI